MKIERNEKIFQTANHLVELLRTCPEYAHYISARERLLHDPINRQIFRELRQKQYALEEASMSGEDFTPKEKLVNDWLMSAALNPVLNDFLNAEYSFSRIIEHLGEIFEPVFPNDDLDEESDEDFFQFLEAEHKQALNEFLNEFNETNYLN